MKKLQRKGPEISPAAHPMAVLLVTQCLALLAPTLRSAPRAPPVLMTPASPGVDATKLLLSFASRGTVEADKEAALGELFSSESRDATLDAALDAIDEAASASLFARRRWPLPLPSRRAVLGTYGRLLDEMQGEEPGSGPRMQEGEAPRRRRFLLVLLRQLKSTRGVWALERTARQRQARATSMAEMLARTPENLETPNYTVISSHEVSGWEVRQYDEFAVCTTARDRDVTADGPKLNSPAMPAAGGFQALAGYIFGKNEQSEKMAMTTPVFTRTGEMSFVLPSRYWKGEVAPPTPIDGGVSLRSQGGGALTSSTELACLWFGGFAGAGEVERCKAALRAAVAADTEWEAVAGEEEEFLLQYNDPFTPPWSRRNEVAMPVRRVAST